MRQVLQSLRDGTVELVEAPAPAVRRGHVLIETRRSLVSAGTERMLLEFGRGNLVEKALSQPDKVRQTLRKARADGLAATVEAVRARLDQPIQPGYCNAGVVLAVGDGVEGLAPGDRVVSNGPHAEIVLVGRNLVARVPDGVGDEEACFAPLAAIALQGCRLAAPTLGETFCVVGLGLVGLIAVQLLRANGCKVIGADFDARRLALAESFGAAPVDLSAGEDPVAAAMAFTGGRGVDGVLITAATSSDAPVSQAARMSRKRGRIVLVGTAGLKLDRSEFYEKELSFQVSCSYGPGRHDPVYEEQGVDYPPGFVRWTEQRNFEAVLDLAAEGRLSFAPLVSEVFDISRAPEAYDRLAAKTSALGLLLAYPEQRPGKTAASVRIAAPVAGPAQPGTIGVIGAGGFAGRVLAPAFRAAGARMKTVVSRGGVTAAVEGRRAGFEIAAADADAVLSDPEIDTVVIATRHDSHADLAVRALEAGKNVWVEKPLALTEAELDGVAAALAGSQRRLMVGFNRRFSPFAVRVRALLDGVAEPKCLIATINAGSVPSTHWTQDPVQGGGRLIGEACHFIDLARFWIGSEITGASTATFGAPTADGVASDKAAITLSFADGSIATIHYLANGPAALSKERYEVFAGGRWLRLDNFRKLEGLGWGARASMRGRQDKGHAAAVGAFLDAVRSGGPSPIAAEELLETGRWTIRAARAAPAAT